MTASARPPGLTQLALVFLSVGMQSFGGGLSAWIRRDVVQRRAWLTEQQFLSGLALCQVTPGPNAVNLAVFVGTTLRGWQGALAALAGMLIVPLLLVLVLGAALVQAGDSPVLASIMAGLGAGAIGMNFAMGIRMSRALRRPSAFLITAIVALTVGFGAPLLLVLAIMLPISLLAAART